MLWHVNCLQLVLPTNATHPRLPPELLERIYFEFLDPHVRLEQLCSAGALDVLRHWHHRHGLTLTAADASRLCQAALSHDRLAVGQWLRQTFGARVDIHTCLRQACERGDLATLRWLHHTFRCTAHDIRNHHNAALRAACQHDHLAVAAWLVQTFALTPADGRAQNNEAFWRACEDGRLHTARWLTTTFGLSSQDARVHDNWPLRAACQHGHLAVAQWLQRTFALTPVDGRAKNNWALHSACARGHLAVARWLHNTCAFTDADVQTPDHWLLREVCACGHVDIMQWLHQHFDCGLRTQGERQQFLQRVHIHSRHHHGLWQWLQSTFNPIPMTP